MDADLRIGAVFVAFSASEGSRSVNTAVLSRRNRADLEDKKCWQLQLYSFLDSERYASLESLLLQAALGHLYVAESVPPAELKKLEEVFAEVEVSHETCSKSAFNDSEVMANLQKLTGDSIMVDLSQYTNALKAAACLLKKGDILRKGAGGGAAAAGGADMGLDDTGDVEGTLELRLENHKQYMRLDAAASRALNLFTSYKEVVGVAGGMTAGGAGGGGLDDDAAAAAAASGNKAGAFAGIASVHALLSHGCRSKGGKRLLKQWLQQPLLDLQAIQLRQELVTAFVQSSMLRSAWKEGLNVPDLEALAGRLNKKVSGLADLQRLHQFAKLLPSLSKRLETYFEGKKEADADIAVEDGSDAAAAAGSSDPAGKALRETYIEKLQWAAGEFERFVEMCEKVIEDISAPQPRISSDWSDELKEMAEEREEIESSVQKLWNQALSSSGWGTTSLGGDLKCERDKVRGYVFRTNKKHDKAVRAIPSVTICSVLKDGLYFTTMGSSGLKALGERILDVEERYAEKSKAIVAQAVEIAHSYVPVLESSAVLIAELDAFAAMAHLACSAPGTYCRPVLTPADGTGSVQIVGGRHPVMEMQEGVSFIANDYSLHREDSRFQIITGPNMAGKSTYIRTLGAIAVLAQIGSYVPAESAELCLFDSLCARVGAGDKATKGISTFMSEMLEAGTILTLATENSLVIIDELGRGTSTYDGFGLAWAMSEHLVGKTRCMTLFATHFHELTALQQTERGVANKHVSAMTSEDRIVMLYAVQDGPCPSSFGIHVAEMAAFPSDVILLAKKKAARLEGTSLVASAMMQVNAAAGAGVAAGAGAGTGEEGKLAALIGSINKFAGAASSEGARLQEMPLSGRKRRLVELAEETGLLTRGE